VKPIVDSGPPVRPKHARSMSNKDREKAIERQNEKIVKSMMYIMRHPGPTDCAEPRRPHKSMNIQIRRKNHQRIQFENSILREKLSEMRSCIPNQGDLKRRWRNQRKLQNRLSKLPLDMNYKRVSTSHGFRSNPRAYLPPPSRLMRPNLLDCGSPKSMRHKKVRHSKSARGIGFGTLQWRLKKEGLPNGQARPSSSGYNRRPKSRAQPRPASRMALRTSPDESLGAKPLVTEVEEQPAKKIEEPPVKDDEPVQAEQQPLSSLTTAPDTQRGLRSPQQPTPVEVNRTSGETGETGEDPVPHAAAPTENPYRLPLHVGFGAPSPSKKVKHISLSSARSSARG